MKKLATKKVKSLTGKMCFVIHKTSQKVIQSQLGIFFFLPAISMQN